MPASLKKVISPRNNMLFQIDSKTLQDKLTHFASASYQMTYSYLEDENLEKTKAPLLQPSYSYTVKSDQEELLESLFNFTKDYFQNENHAIGKFVDVIAEFQTLAALEELTKFFKHPTIEALIDRQAEYSQFQEIVDGFEQQQSGLMENLYLDAKLIFGMQIQQNLNRLKAYYPFIESFLAQYAKLANEPKGTVITNFFCFIVRRDRVRTSYQLVLSAYVHKLKRMYSKS